MAVTVVGENNASLNIRAAIFARSTVVELISRPHVDVFYQERLIPPNIDLHMKLMPSPNNFGASQLRLQEIRRKKITSWSSTA